jgi:hypothetical protein
MLFVSPYISPVGQYLANQIPPDAVGSKAYRNAGFA